MKTIGIIGLGSIGKRHARNLVAMGHDVLVYDPEAGRRSGFKYRELLENLIEDSEAIIIASPTKNHREHFVAAGEAGKAIFVEKPIFATQEDYDFLAPGIWASGSPKLMVGYNLRFHSCVKQASEWINSQMIGEPLWANFTVAQYSNKPDYLRDGVILNWSHEIDLALHLVGPAQVRSCVAINKESMADIILSHTNGCQSTVHLDYVTQPEIRQSLIVGTDAMIIMDLVNRHAWLRGPEGSLWDQFEGQDSWDENYVEEMEAFIGRLDGEETLGCTGEEGLEVLRICLQAKSAAGLN